MNNRASIFCHLSLSRPMSFPFRLCSSLVIGSVLKVASGITSTTRGAGWMNILTGQGFKVCSIKMIAGNLTQ